VITVVQAPLTTLEQARDQILAGVQAKPAEAVALAEALGRVLAEPVIARLTLPPWDNSAMDGFAVRSADIADARPDAPVALPVVGEVAAGSAPAAELRKGTALRIFTGAPVPPGADAVVPVEDTDAPPGSRDGGATLPASVAIFAAAPDGAHIRRAGSDIRTGDSLLQSGRRLSPAHLALAAAGGHWTLPVHAQSRVAVLATGDELAAPGAPLGPAQIPDSNSIGLVAQARECGAEVRSFGIAGDRLDEVLARLREAIEWADVVVVSGGVSVGAHDVVKDAFEELGQLELWRVAVQPGKPLAFGRATGPRPVLLFGLPGNPVSSFVTFELFVRPVLRRLAGYDDVIGRPVVRAHLVEGVRKAPDRRAFLRVRLVGNEARLAGGQGSHVLSALALANALAIVPEGVSELPAGAEVDVMRLDSELES
jgi:molybdopterin molybdotransferase